MTWTLVSSFNGVDSSQTSTNDASKVVGLLDWVETNVGGRSYTTNSFVGDTDNKAYTYNKTITCLDGSDFELKFAFNAAQNSGSEIVSFRHYNQNDTNTNTIAKVSAAGLATDTGYATENIDLTGDWKFWASDVDGESFMIIQERAGFYYQRWFEGTAGSRERCEVSSSSNVGANVINVLPFGEYTWGKRSTSAYDAYVWEDNSISYGAGDPYIIHGVSQITGSYDPLYKMFQEDISTFFNPTVSTAALNNYATNQINTLKVGADYYIRWGNPANYAQMLLKTGAVNPGY